MRKVNGRSQYLLNGRGHTVMRSGQPRPGHYSQRKGRQIVNAGTSTTGWSAAAGCTLDTASVTNPEGVAQTLVRFVGTADNTTAFFDCTSAPFNAAQLGREGIEFDLYYAPGEPYTQLGNTVAAFSVIFNDAGGTNAVRADFEVRQGWQRIRLKKADFTNISGTGNWDTTAFARLRFRINAKANVTHTVHMRNLGYMANTPAKICVQFDDIGESVYTIAFPIMKARGIVGSCAVISDAIGQDAFAGYNRLTAAEMREMKAAGWDFVNHTKSHQVDVLPTATQADCLTEIATCRDAIISNGIGNGVSEYLFCAPYGEYGTNYWAAAAEAGCKMFRGTVGSTNQTPEVAEADVILSPLVQVPVIYVVEARTTAFVLGQVDSMIGRGGYQILLYHHVIETSTADIERSTAKFTADMDGLLTRAKDLEFCNMTTLYESTRL